MAASRHRAIRRSLAHRVCAALALICYLTTSMGFPLPSFASKPGGQAFPCQNHPCGCATAEECWTHCCCFTPDEHWAWAQANHVEPPSYAEPPRTEGWRTIRLRDRCAHENGSCCATPQADGACCRAKDSARAKPGKASSPGHRWLVGFCSMKCRGGISHWIAIGAVAPPPRTLGWQMYWPALAWLSLAGDHPHPQTLLPLDPPPRLLRAV
jgi:hypothetical protein